MQVLGSSVRTVPPDVTLSRAKKRASSLGVTRVTDITRLDRVGIPTFASIRPAALVGSLCVNAGKGVSPIEAEVGATMEAIEFALAEPAASVVRSVRATPRDVLDGRARPEAIVDLCPRIGARIRLDSPMECVAAESLTGDKGVLVPAELVFLPFCPRRRQAALFGATSNGLASGNTVEEATLHALSELVERDIRAFQAFRDTSVRVDLTTVDGPAALLVAQIEAAGLELFVRTVFNPFGLSYFAAIIHDPDTQSPHLLNGGYGCHPLRTVAFTRAVTEAAQSRLSFIHGGRDDLVVHAARFSGWGRARKLSHVKRVLARARREPSVSYASLRDSLPARSVEAFQGSFLERLVSLGFPHAYRVTFCAPEDELQVVRVIVPRLELFSDSICRLGPRLRDHARAL